MGAYDFLSWRYEPVAVRRERERQQFSALRQTITPLVQSGNSLDMLRAQQAVRASQRLNAPEKKPYNTRILEKVRERVQEVAAASAQPKTDFTRPGFSGKISGEDDGGGGFLGGIKGGIKKGLGAVGDVFDEGAETAIEGVKKAGAGLEWLNERTAEPAFAIASGQISAKRKPILDAQGRPTGRFYRDKPSFLDMAQGIGSFIKDPAGAYEEGREAFGERLANPSQNLVSRLALTGAADVTNIAGAGLLTQGLRAGAKARAGTRLGKLLSGAAKTNVAIDVAPTKVAREAIGGVAGYIASDQMGGNLRQNLLAAAGGAALGNLSRGPGSRFERLVGKATKEGFGGSMVFNTGRVGKPRLVIPDSQAYGLRMREQVLANPSSRFDDLRTADIAAARPRPLANERLWFHSTNDTTFDLPDPDKAVGTATGITQGPGVYMAADPAKSAGRYGNRTFVSEFDGNVLDLTAPADEALWERVRASVEERLGVRIEQFDHTTPEGRIHSRAELGRPENNYGFRDQLVDDVAETLRLGRSVEGPSRLPGALGRFKSVMQGGSFKREEAALAIVNDTLADSGIDAVFHHSPRADGDVLIVLNGQAARALGEVRNAPDIVASGKSWQEIMGQSRRARGEVREVNAASAEVQRRKAAAIRAKPGNLEQVGANEYRWSHDELPIIQRTGGISISRQSDGTWRAEFGNPSDRMMNKGVVATGDSVETVARDLQEQIAVRQESGRAIEGQPLPDVRSYGRAEPVSDAFGVIGTKNPPIGGGSIGGYAYRLRDFDDVAKEVSTTGNPIKQLLIGKTGINPSVMDSEFGKNITAYVRQHGAGEQLAETAVSAALDPHNPAGGLRQAVGPGGVVFDIADDGGIRNLGASSGAVWQDVLERPFNYQLTSAQQAYVDDWHGVAQDIQALRDEFGLPRFPARPDGSIHVPRITRSVRGIELPDRMPKNVARVYELAEDGVANGVRYDLDPRNTLLLYTRATYEEIAEKQLSDAIESFSVSASELVPAPVKNRMLAAIENRKAVERSVRNEIVQARKNLARSADTPRKVELRKADLAKLEKLTKYDGPARLDTARAQYQKAKTAYSAAMKRARVAKTAPGYLFGKQEGTVGVGQWRNRFFLAEDYQRLVDVVGGFGGVARPKPNAIAKGFEGIGNVTRYAASVGDFAAPFVQGLPALARDPVAWGKATAKHYQAFFDPTVQSKFVRQHLETFQWMSQHGIPIGDPEFFTAGGPTGEIAAIGRGIEKVPGGSLVTKPVAAIGKQTAGRFGSAYGTFLGVDRALLIEGLRKSWKGTDADLAQYIRNMTGGLDPRALGVGPSRRAAESTWLAFSPRLLRSTVALVADAAQGAVKSGGLDVARGASLLPTSIVGHAGTAQGEAAFTLARLAAGAAGIYVATGLALGKDWEEIEGGMNPLNGKQFLSYQINGDWIGVGGQVRALTQFAANLAANPLKLKEMSADNPLVAFYMSRGAPALNTAGGLLEVAGADVLRYEDIESFPDLLKHIGTSALPFALQGVLEGQNVETTLLGLTGVRTSAETPTDKLNAIAQKIIDPKTGQPYGKDFYDSEPRIRDLIKQKYPHIWADAVAKGSENRQKAEQARNELNAQQEAEDAQFLAGQVSREDWLASYRERQDELFYRQKEIYGDSEFARGDTPLDRYYAKREELTDPATNRLTDEGWRQLDEWVAQQKPEDRDYIDSNRGLGGTPLVRAYREVQRTQDEYYSLPKYRGYTADEAVQIDELWQEARNNARSADDRDMLRGLRRVLQGSEVDAKVVRGVRRRILGMLRQTRDRERFRRKHPELDAFYGRGPLTAEEVVLLEGMAA